MELKIEKKVDEKIVDGLVNESEITEKKIEKSLNYDELTKEEKAADRKLTDNYSIKGEFIANGFEKNTLKIEKGVIAMARSDYSSLNQRILLIREIL